MVPVWEFWTKLITTPSTSTWDLKTAPETEKNRMNLRGNSESRGAARFADLTARVSPASWSERRSSRVEEVGSGPEATANNSWSCSHSSCRRARGWSWGAGGLQEAERGLYCLITLAFWTRYTFWRPFRLFFCILQLPHANFSVFSYILATLMPISLV